MSHSRGSRACENITVIEPSTGNSTQPLKAVGSTADETASRNKESDCLQTETALARPMRGRCLSAFILCKTADALSESAIQSLQFESLFLSENVALLQIG